MLDITFENLALVIALVVLAGPMLGSMIIYFSGAEPRTPEGSHGSAQAGNRRPAEWPKRNAGAATYHSPRTGSERSSGRRPSLLFILLAGGLAYAGASAGTFVYQSPWSAETDLRHLAATLHCDIAERAGLAPARQGEPGYHIRNDRDANGIACDVHAPAHDVAQKPRKSVINQDKLSSLQLTWPNLVVTGTAPAAQ